MVVAKGIAGFGSQRDTYGIDREETLRSIEEQAETSPKGGFQYHRNQECIENLKD